MDDDDEVGARHRFLTDPSANKIIQSLGGMYNNALHEDDDEAQESTVPTISRNDHVLLLNGLFDLMAEVLGTQPEDTDEDEEDIDDSSEDEDDETASLSFPLSIEEAKDKRMSVYYKAFMGEMRNLVNPWFGNADKFLDLWARMGNKLYDKSPAKKPKKPKLLITRYAKATEASTEAAAVIGAVLPLASKVIKALSDMGFVPCKADEDGDAAWMKSGVDDGFPDMQVFLVRREDNSYLVMLSKANKYDAYGKIIKRRVLTEGATPAQLISAIAFMYDQMAQE